MTDRLFYYGGSIAGALKSAESYAGNVRPPPTTIVPVKNRLSKAFAKAISTILKPIAVMNAQGAAHEDFMSRPRHDRSRGFAFHRSHWRA